MNIAIASPTRFCTNRAIQYMINKYCPKRNAAILDVGCGKGHYHQFFSSSDIQGSYLGVDIKKQESWQTKEENGMQIEYLVHDAEKLPDLNRKFNFIVAIQSLEHILNDAEAMKGMRMSLNNDGHITITVPSKYCFFIYPTHGHRRYSLPIIKRLAGKSSLRIEEIVRIGGLINFVLHFILWTIPSAFNIKIGKYYRKKLISLLINRLERLSVHIDKVFCLFEGGYAVTLTGGDSRPE